MREKRETTNGDRPKEYHYLDIEKTGEDLQSYVEQRLKEAYEEQNKTPPRNITGENLPSLLFGADITVQELFPLKNLEEIPEDFRKEEELRLAFYFIHTTFP